jgi:hypothetical protein
LRIGWVPPNSILTSPLVSSSCMSQVPPNSISTHLFLLQVHSSQREALVHAQMSFKYGRAKFQRLKRVRTSLIWTFCSSFTTNRASAHLDVWFLHFNVPLPVKKWVKWSEMKAHYSNKNFCQNFCICNYGSNNMKLFFNFVGVFSD